MAQFRESALVCFSTGSSSSSMFPIFSLLSISPLSIAAPSLILVLWKLPMDGWLKVNVDGSSANERSGFWGIFGSSESLVLGAFASNTNFESAVAAESLAFIEAVRIAWIRDWK